MSSGPPTPGRSHSGESSSGEQWRAIHDRKRQRTDPIIHREIIILDSQGLLRIPGRTPGWGTADRELFETALDPEIVEALRKATNGGWAAGREAFKAQIAEALKRRVARLPKGRPPSDASKMTDN
jgi:hypothetical protein